METIRAYTTIEQSRKLAEILPLESADMCYINGDSGKISIGEWGNNVHDEDDIPCWSLAALFNILPKQFDKYVKSLYWFDDTYHCSYENEDWESKYWVSADNLIDACFKMIIKLNEFKML